MTRLRSLTSPLALAISFVLLITSSSAITLRVPDGSLPTPSFAAAAAGITPGPPLVDLERPRLEVRSVTLQSCARQCFANAITKSTGCQIGDYACQCETVNANVIEAGSFACIEASCGAFVAEDVLSSAGAFCLSVRNGQLTVSGVPQTKSSPSATKPSGDSASTTSYGSTETSPSTGSSGSPGPSSGSSSSSLSTGAIVGIAIGAAAGGAIVCAILYWFCLRKSKRSKAPGGDASTTAAAVPPNSHLDGKSGNIATSTNPSTAAGVSPYPNTVSSYPSNVPSPSPVSQTSPPVYPGITELPNGAWQQHQQHQYQNPQQLPPNLAPGVHQPIPPQQGGYAPPYGQHQAYHEVQGQGVRPEMYAETQARPELHGQAYGGGVYEMPAERRS